MSAAGVPDRVVVHPQREGLRGRLVMPGDKSLSHRAFLLGALTGGPVRVSGAAQSEDVEHMVGALRAMGVRISGGPLAALVEGPPREPDDVLDCGNSGTAMRLLAGVCAGIDGLSVLTGDRYLRARPMGRIAEPLRRMGARVDGRGGGALAPLAIRGAGLTAGAHELPVASAQVKSALLLAGLRADGETRVREPGPSRDHTERMLRWLGADVRSAPGEVVLTPGPLRPRPLEVSGDPSSAAFWMVAAAIIPDSDVRVCDLCLNPTRTGALDVLTAMGADIDAIVDRSWCGEPVGDVAIRGSALGRADVAGDLVVRSIDELPVLAVAGALGGGIRVRDAAELRVKEVDRIEAVAAMLGAVGIAVDTAPDGFTVRGGSRPTGGSVDSRGDHRIAMAACIAALAAAEPVVVSGFRAVASSYPTFLRDLTALGGRWEEA